MNKKIFFTVLILLFLMPAFSQKKDDKAEKKEEEKKVVGDQVYFEVTLEDFETTKYTDKNISYRVSNEQKAGITIRDQYPAPYKNSKKYLGVKIYGRSGDVLTITPEKKIVINKYCKNISMWVYGKNFSGELSILLKDANQLTHRIIIGKLDFLGWRKLTVKLMPEVIQEDKYLSVKTELEILKILYNPGNRGRLPLWNYFYIDDITASVREKYTDKQSDEW